MYKNVAEIWRYDCNVLTFRFRNVQDGVQSLQARKCRAAPIELLSVATRPERFPHMPENVVLMLSDILWPMSV